MTLLRNLSLALLAWVMLPSIAFSKTAPLQKIAEIRALPRDLAATGIPVDIQGVVTSTTENSIFLHDGENGIYASFGDAKARGLWPHALPGMTLQPGTKVRIQGRTDPGGFSPMIFPTSAEILGTAPMPTPRALPVGRLLSGNDDCQWIVLEGVVQGIFDPRKSDVNFTDHLRIMVEGQVCIVCTPIDLSRHQADLVDAKIRVTGVFAPSFNLRSQITAIKIHINNIESITVLKPPPKDPFSAPRVELDRLLQFSPTLERDHRVVTSGVVTFAAPGRFFYLQDGQKGIRVQSTQTGLHPGDIVEAAAFIDTERLLAGLKEAEVRVIGKSDSIEPELLPIRSILAPEVRDPWQASAESDADGRLVRIEGILRRVTIHQKWEESATLLVEKDDHLFLAHVPLPTNESVTSAENWVEGSRVSLTGICELDLRRTEKAGWVSIDNFHLLLDSTSGLSVLEKPSWWTPKRLAIAISSLVVILLLAMFWVIALRRQVANRSDKLAREIAAREAASHEFELTLRERRRLAADLHDSLEQSLTGLALQLEAVALYRESAPERGSHHLQLARKFLDRSRSEVRSTIWDLRTQGLSGTDLASVIRESATDLAVGSQLEIDIDSNASHQPLPAVITSNLVLASQEAITNAIKHSGASRIDVTIRYQSAVLTLTVRDNGKGFNPKSAPGQADGHFGLQGIHERIKRLGGTFTLESSPGHGTTLTFTIPISDFPLVSSTHL
ncbi:MAG: sensor histidine kinase [Verrucomicrobia bacterium]|nr:MAG: sensor histidine kinase [Verrucomicrobiota bacterium]